MGVQACNPVLRGQGTRLLCVQTQPCQPTELQPGVHSKTSSQKKKQWKPQQELGRTAALAPRLAYCAF